MFFLKSEKVLKKGPSLTFTECIFIGYILMSIFYFQWLTETTVLVLRAKVVPPVLMKYLIIPVSVQMEGMVIGVSVSIPSCVFFFKVSIA